MPLFPAYNYFSLIALLLILIFMFFNPDTRVSVAVGVIFLALMTAISVSYTHLDVYKRQSRRLKASLSVKRSKLTWRRLVPGTWAITGPMMIPA